MSDESIGTINKRRLETPGNLGWAKSVRPDAEDRYFVVTTDSHVSEPIDVYTQGGIDKRFYDRLPSMRIDDEGRQWLEVEGMKPQLVKGRPQGTEYEKKWKEEGLDTVAQAWSDRMEPDDLDRMRASSTRTPDAPGLSRLKADFKRDGIDASVLFANRGFLSFFPSDPELAHAMSHAWNVWAKQTFEADWGRYKTMAMVPTHDIEGAIKEAKWAIEAGFPGVTIPALRSQPDEKAYNHPDFDPLWALIAEAEIPLTIHVASGRDPRAAAGGRGGAILNFVLGAASQVLAPLATFLAAGTFERHPKLKMGTIEGGIGWLPWLLESVDEVYFKHHMWVRPYHKNKPSEAFRTNCFASFQEDVAGLKLAREYDLIDNIMWGNDYPHMEGTWPHSAEALERQMGDFSEEERAKIVGGNAARVFNINTGAAARYDA